MYSLNSYNGVYNLKDKILCGFMLIFTIVFFSASSMADLDMDISVETDGDVNYTQIIAANGSVISEHSIYGSDSTLIVNGVDWTEYNPNFIKTSEGSWSKDRGIEMYQIAEAFENMEKFRKGDTNEITEEEYEMLIALLGITDEQIGDFYNSQISPTLKSHYDQISNNIYEIMALYRTFEKLHPDVYCESRKEVMKEYGLKSVKCGLHSKICYNGDYYTQELGEDYCIYTDDGHSEDGMSIHLDYIKVYKTDESNLIPIELKLFNTGEETLKPVIKVDLKKWENVIGHFERELEEVEGEKTYMLAMDNGGLKAGDYTLRITIDLDRKEINKDVDFTILPDGSVPKEGEIVSFDMRTGESTLDAIIDAEIKNTGESPASFQTLAKIYREGELLDVIETGKVLIMPEESRNFEMNYRIEDWGEYQVVLSSGENMEEELLFDAVPNTPTGRFMSSPGFGVISFMAILVLGLYGVRFVYHKIDRKGTVEVTKTRRKKSSSKKRTRCAAKTKKGKRCKNYAKGKSKYCGVHKK